MKKNVKTVGYILLIVGLVVLYPRVYGFIEGMFDALRSSDLRQAYENKSNDWLLNEMNSYNYMRAHIAYGILVDRKEKRAVPIIIEKMKREKANEPMYLQALASIGDREAIPAIVEVMNSQEDKSGNNEVYREAVIALSKLKYEPIWDSLVELAQSKRASDMSLAIYAMRDYGNKSAIEYLREIEARLLAGDYIPWMVYHDGLGESLERKVSPEAAKDAIVFLDSKETQEKPRDGSKI